MILQLSLSQPTNCLPTAYCFGHRWVYHNLEAAVSQLADKHSFSRIHALKVMLITLHETNSYIIREQYLKVEWQLKIKKINTYQLKVNEWMKGINYLNNNDNIATLKIQYTCN